MNAGEEERFIEGSIGLTWFHAAAATGIWLLSALAAWGDWWLVGLAIGLNLLSVPFNVLINSLVVKRYGVARTEAVRTIGNLVAILWYCHVAHWPVVVWLWLPFLALAFYHSGAVRLVAIPAFFCLAFDGLALRDGVAWIHPLMFTALAIHAWWISRRRHQALHRLWVRSEEQRAGAAAMQEELLEMSREAGMAELATTVLHNVGNVLNSINVSASVVAAAVQSSKNEGVVKVARLLAEQPDPLAFLTGDERGRRLPEYLRLLGPAIESERALVAEELRSLAKNVEHVKAIIGMQQAQACSRGGVETLSLGELLDDALKLSAASFEKLHVAVARDYVELPPLVVDRHRLLQIVMNLLANARQAMREQPGEPLITVRTRRADGGHVAIEVADNGCGISPQNLARLFQYGFTTKRDGHGFGLHSSAGAAAELGGTLTAHSDGPGRGACFTLRIPTCALAAAKRAA